VSGSGSGTPSLSPTGSGTGSPTGSPSRTGAQAASPGSPPSGTAAASASAASGGAPFQHAAALSSALSLEWAVVVPSRRALGGGGGARAASAAEAPYLFARLNCSVPGAWAAFAVASAPNAMAGLDAVLVQPAEAPAAAIRQATVGGERSAAAVALVDAAAGSLLPALSTFAVAAGGGWSATFARRLPAGAYPRALAIREGGASTTITVAWGRRGAGAFAAGHAPADVASSVVDFATGAAAAAPRPSALRLLYVHGALMFAAWGLLLPAAVGAAAALQKTALHKRLGVAGWAASAAAFALAVAATGMLERPHFSGRAGGAGGGAHAALGLFTFLAGLAQPLLALAAPGAHKLVGRALVFAVAPATIFLGLSAPLLELPVGLTAAYAVVLAGTLGALAWGARCAARGSPVSTSGAAAAAAPANAGGAWVTNPCPAARSAA